MSLERVQGGLSIRRASKCSLLMFVQVLSTVAYKHVKLTSSEPLAPVFGGKNMSQNHGHPGEIRSSDILSVFRREKTVGPATPEFLHWCKEQGLPQSLREHFAQCSIYGHGTAFGPGAYLYGETRIIEAAKKQPELLDAGFLHLGYCPNGDLVVMDLTEESLPIEFVSHELFWTSPVPPPRSCFVRVADNLCQFMKGWDDGAPFLPPDYYSAKERGQHR